MGSRILLEGAYSGQNRAFGEARGGCKKSFDGFDELKRQMSEASVKQFGSGWGWLLVNPDGSLKIAATPNQDNPLMGKAIGACGCIPILTIDVWTHAYYLKYKNLAPSMSKYMEFDRLEARERAL